MCVCIADALALQFPTALVGGLLLLLQASDASWR
jgi:hypothetical protein